MNHAVCLFQVDQTLLHKLEAVCEEAIGGPSWGSALEPEVIANLGKYRKYNSSSLRDLLRVIRNKHNHFREMPPDLQQRLGALPEGFLRCCPCVCLSVCLPACLPACLCLSSACLPASLCLSVCPSVCLSGWLSVCLSALHCSSCMTSFSCICCCLFWHYATQQLM